MRGEIDLGRSRAAAIAGTAVQVAEIDIEIFALRRPIAGQCEFHAAAHRPADIAVAFAGEARRARLDVAEGGAAEDERQPAIDGIAEPRARGAEPAVGGGAAERAGRIRAAVDVGPG